MITAVAAGGATVTAVVVLVTVAFVASISLARHRRGSSSTREVLFVGRTGGHGPELFLVGKRVRRLAPPEDQQRLTPFDESGPGPLAFAPLILFEVMHCRAAGRLAQAFADAHLTPFPDDGFVMSTRAVEAWLETRQLGRAPSDTGA